MKVVATLSLLTIVLSRVSAVRPASIPQPLTDSEYDQSTISLIMMTPW